MRNYSLLWNVCGLSEAISNTPAANFNLVVLLTTFNIYKLNTGCCWLCTFHLHITSCGAFIYVSQSHRETAETVEVSSLNDTFRPDSAGTEHTVKVGRVTAVCVTKAFGGLEV